MKIATDANFPMSSEGQVYHLAIANGQCANRIVQAGSAARIKEFSMLMDALPAPFESVSSRGFTVITGRYKGVPVSLIASGMVRNHSDTLWRRFFTTDSTFQLHSERLSPPRQHIAHHPIESASVV